MTMPMSDNDLPQRIVIDTEGHYWRWYEDMYGQGPMYSMCPTSTDNDPLTEAAVYVPERAWPLAPILESALALLADNNIHGPLSNGYCAVCEGQCMKSALIEGEK